MKKFVNNFSYYVPNKPMCLSNKKLYVYVIKNYVKKFRPQFYEKE